MEEWHFIIGWASKKVSVKDGHPLKTFLRMGVSRDGICKASLRMPGLSMDISKGGISKDGISKDGISMNGHL